MGGDVEGGVLAGAGGQHVQCLAAHALGDQGVGGVDGGALGAVRGGRVQQLDLVVDVGGGQGEQPAVAEVPDPQRPVLEPPVDLPGVAVLDPVPPAEHRQPPVVEPRDDPVPCPARFPSRSRTP